VSEKDQRMIAKALELGNRQADEIARLSLVSVRYRRAMVRALHQARYGKIKSAIETLEKELNRNRQVTQSQSGSNVHFIDPT
jgi:hypothetical protein